MSHSAVPRRPLTEPGRFRIKQAAPEQLAEAAAVKARAWRESYPFSEEVFEQVDRAVAGTAEAWDQDSRQGNYFWIVVDSAHDSEVVGVAHARVSDRPDAPTPLELAMIYLLDVAKGSGIADRLMEVTIGDSPAHLWVLEGNERAISFYRRHGFVEDGARHMLGGPLADRAEIRMVRGVEQP